MTTVLQSFQRSNFKYMQRPPPAAADRIRLCAVCKKTVTGPVHHCSDTDIDVHPECAGLQTWVRVGDVEFGLRRDGNGTTCGRCKRKTMVQGVAVGGFCYVSTCFKRGYHVDCFKEMEKQEGSKVLGSFPDSTFECVQLPPYPRRFCDVCGMSVKPEPVYHCFETDVDVHLHCASLDEWLRMDNLVFGLRKDGCGTNCVWCEKKKVQRWFQPRVRGLWYVSSCGNHSFHVYCLFKKMKSATPRDQSWRSIVGVVLPKFLNVAVSVTRGILTGILTGDYITMGLKLGAQAINLIINIPEFIRNLQTRRITSS